MLRKSNLQLVESPAFFRREQAIFSAGTENDAHSLHQLVQFPQRVHPEFVSFLLARYSKKDEVVLDPFCGSGTIGLEAALAGRTPFLSDVSTLALKMARAKLEPADITEVTLAMQQLGVSRPVDVSSYSKYFSEFFELQTFHEICNLRLSLASAEDRISRFIQSVLLGILHGNSAGYLSSYTNPQTSLTPDEQRDLNIKRRQSPDYRAVSPRILRRTAMLLRDGCPSVLLRCSSKKQLSLSDARDLSFVRPGEPGMILTSPPLPGEQISYASQWLRLWMLGVSEADYAVPVFDSLENWLDFMNATLVEFARVSRFGVRCVLMLPEEFQSGFGGTTPEAALIQMIEQDLSFFWQLEGLWGNARKTNVLAENFRSSSSRKQEERSQALVLRRR